MIKKLFALALLLGLAGQLLAAPAVKPRKPKAKAPVKVVDKTMPGFIYQPAVYRSYVMDADVHPVLTFFADEDVTAVVWESDASGKNHVSREPIFRGRLRRGAKQDVQWQSVTLPNGRYNFHIILTDRVGNSSAYDAPFTIDIINNPNRDLVLY